MGAPPDQLQEEKGADAVFAWGWLFLPALLLASNDYLPWYGLLLLAALSWGVHFLLTLAHEAAHYTVGRACGFTFSEFVVGRGPRLARFTLGGTEFRFGALPNSGHVSPRAHVAQFSLARMTAFVGAGAAAEAVLGLLAAIYLPREWLHSPALIERIAYYALLFTVIFTLFDVFNSLRPRAEGESHNDRKILDELWQDRPNLARKRAQFEAGQQFQAAVEAKDPSQALDLAEAALARWPDDYALADSIGSLLAEMGFIDEAARAWTRALGNSEISLAQRVTTLDSLACIPLYHGRLDYLDRAAQWIAEAVKLDPAAITLQGTQGSILIEQGRYAEGQAILRRVASESSALLDRAISSAYLAKAAAAEGKPAEAASLLATARELHPEHVVVARIVRELAGPAATPA